MKRKVSLGLTVTIGLFAARCALAGQAGFDEKAVANFYRGKTVTIVVGHSAGGGFDRYGRAIARHLGKYIPGNPAVLVNNMVGAGTMVSANYTYNQAPKDGTVVNSFDGGLLPSQLYGSSPCNSIWRSSTTSARRIFSNTSWWLRNVPVSSRWKTS